MRAPNQGLVLVLSCVDPPVHGLQQLPIRVRVRVRVRVRACARASAAPIVP